VADWTYLLADLMTGAVTAEIELTGVRVSQRLNTAGTMTGTWAVPQNWRGSSPYVLTTPARTMGVALRDGRPVFGGILWTRRPDPEKQTVDLGFSDWFSYFDARMVLPVFTPDGTTSQVSSLGTTFGQVEQNDIARALVDQAQAATGGNIGIVADTTVSGILRDRSYAGHELVNVGTALRQLAEVIDGPDIAFGVAPELDSNGRVVKTMRIGDPKLGVDGSAHVFELGANALGYRFDSDGTRMVTRSYVTGEGTEAGQLIAVAENSARYSDGWPVLEQETNRNTTSSDATLQEHADAELRRNWLPVVTPQVTVLGDGRDASGRKLWPSIGEVQVGDEVRLCIRDFFFAEGLDVNLRVVALDYQPDGVETMSLTMNAIVDDIA
jgi:hypothetical protein